MIERSNGLDRANSGHFAKKSLILLKISPQSNNKASPLALPAPEPAEERGPTVVALPMAC
jgi:hypothetical protein